ncbi:hypothetical protein V6N11_069092 [Hibiscus sabdariffa]|uniref:Uncharacterized protein n=1 Tax=Hibiscus sabdariffa TaxID=183260 RepID=A0ABR2A5N7_9ROSI
MLCRRLEIRHLAAPVVYPPETNILHSCAPRALQQLSDVKCLDDSQRASSKLCFNPWLLSIFLIHTSSDSYCAYISLEKVQKMKSDHIPDVEPNKPMARENPQNIAIGYNGSPSGMKLHADLMSNNWLQ